MNALLDLTAIRSRFADKERLSAMDEERRQERSEQRLQLILDVISAVLGVVAGYVIFRLCL